MNLSASDNSIGGNNASTNNNGNISTHVYIADGSKREQADYANESRTKRETWNRMRVPIFAHNLTTHQVILQRTISMQTQIENLGSCSLRSIKEAQKESRTEKYVQQILDIANNRQHVMHIEAQFPP